MILQVILKGILFLILVVPGTHSVFAMQVNKEITPYGDYCSLMSHYGMHRTIVDWEHAEKAVRHYYDKKGLDIEILGGQGRFLKIKIKKEDEEVDTIIFDRRTGRIRSVY